MSNVANNNEVAKNQVKNTPITPKKLNLQKILINLQIINNIIVKIHK